MLRRIAFTLLLLLGTAAGLRAQSTGGNVGNTVLVRFTGAPSGGCLPNQEAVNNATNDFYVCNSSTFMWVKVGSGGGGGSPGAPTNSIQFNSGGTSLGGIANLLNGTALNCDGMMNGCVLKFTNTGTPPYMIYGTDGMGGFIDFYQDAGLFLDGSIAGTFAGQLGLAESPGGTFLTAQNGSGVTGLKLETDQRLVAQGRLQYSTTYLTAVSGTNFTLGAGWGSTASVTNAGGSDNNFLVEITTGGSGIAANPTLTFTYADGDMSEGGSTVVYVCGQSGGNDIIADVTTTTRNQTNEIFTWHGTPTTGKVYELTCIGAATN